MLRFPPNFLLHLNSSLVDNLSLKQEAIPQKQIVFRFQKDIQSEKGWGFDLSFKRGPRMKAICAIALLCALLIRAVARAWGRFFVEARYSTEPIVEKEEL